MPNIVQITRSDLSQFVPVRDGSTSLVRNYSLWTIQQAIKQDNILEIDLTFHGGARLHDMPGPISVRASKSSHGPRLYWFERR